MWACSMGGECCRAVSSVVMTDSERAVIESLGMPASPLVWLDPPAPGMQALKAGPCPLLAADGRCTVYASRPYNCRRFGCFREPGESLVEAAQLLELRTVIDNRVRSQRRSMQRAAQPWARAHGWHDEMT